MASSTCRFWEDQIREEGDMRSVLVVSSLDRRNSHGRPERLRHVRRTNAGAPVFCVVCSAVSAGGQGAGELGGVSL